MLITSVYGISAPSKGVQIARQKRVKQIIEAMGDKYLLNKLIPKKDDATAKDSYVPAIK